ncbi:MAG: hypothetical protein BGO99_07640 [Nitrosospira sp. 56-18]|nr:MAG: hypothetical protein BGO99_07640 [Nitrosospira sp. 56-18]
MRPLTKLLYTARTIFAIPLFHVRPLISASPAQVLPSPILPRLPASLRSLHSGRGWTRSSTQIDEFEAEQRDPLIKAIHESGVEYDDVGALAHCTVVMMQ